MGKQVTIAEIAKRAKVSPAAVARVVLGTGEGQIRVGPDTTRRIQRLARQLNYTPNKAAQQLAGKKSRVIGVLIDPQPREINYQRLALIEQIARAKGYRLLIGYERPEVESLKTLVNDFLSRGVEGLICVHHTYPGDTQTVPKTILKLTKRVVFVDEPAEVEGALWAGPDFSVAGKIAVEHLASRGCRRIALTVGDLAWYGSPRIKAGHAEALKSCGLVKAHSPVWVAQERLTDPVDQMTPDIAQRIVDDLVKQGEVDAIIASDDESAALIIGELLSRGLRVPQDVAVVGIGNQTIGGIIRPAITSIDLELGKVADAVVNILLDRVISEDAPAHAEPFTPVRILPKLIQRDSS